MAVTSVWAADAELKSEVTSSKALAASNLFPFVKLFLMISNFSNTIMNNLYKNNVWILQKSQGNLTAALDL
jgi:hypothetical protein